MLFTSHQLHRHSRSNPHPISWSSINPVLPTHVMGAHSTGCRPTHQPYIRRPDQHHPVFEYSHKTDQSRLRMLKNNFFLLFLHFFFLFVGVFEKNMYLCNQK
ncbi:Uncharacterised protein [Segatella copri]|nr:Uncharacterised protein [Segatella copri]